MSRFPAADHPPRHPKPFGVLRSLDPFCSSVLVLDDEGRQLRGEKEGGENIFIDLLPKYDVRDWLLCLRRPLVTQSERRF